MPGEFDFIQWVRAQQAPSERVLLPAGDDLAVLKWPADDLLLVGVDQVLDGVHFDSAVHSPRAIGRKAMNRNLSDCAAMGCLPAAALMAVATTKGTGTIFLQELYGGAREAAAAFGCEIVGGDTASWPEKLIVSVTILGRSAGVTPVTRTGAKVGDKIWVTGPLGGSLLGRHMTFEPRVTLGRQLAGAGVTAMIDLSDGLSRDLRHLCEQSGVGALISAPAIPVHEDAVEMRRDGRSPLEHALHDGEDYELLFTAPILPAELPAIFIGWITAEPNVQILYREGDGIAKPLEPEGWEHTL